MIKELVSLIFPECYHYVLTNLVIFNQEVNALQKFVPSNKKRVFFLMIWFVLSQDHGISGSSDRCQLNIIFSESWQDLRQKGERGKLLSVLNIFIERKLSINFDIYQGVDHFYLFAGILPDKVHLYQGVNFYKSFKDSDSFILSIPSFSVYLSNSNFILFLFFRWLYFRCTN